MIRVDTGFLYLKPTASPLVERETSWYIPNWVDDMIHKVDDMIQSFKDLMSGKLIKDAIEGLVVLLVDELMSPLYDAFAKSYLFTPQIAEIDKVRFLEIWSAKSLGG